MLQPDMLAQAVDADTDLGKLISRLTRHVESHQDDLRVLTWFLAANLETTGRTTNYIDRHSNPVCTHRGSMQHRFDGADGMWVFSHAWA